MADTKGIDAALGEAGAEQQKPACEVHGGDLFVKLHFKAAKETPGVDIVNTVVTSRDESSAKFSGCGRHLVALTTGGDKDDKPLAPKDAEAAVRKYCSVMFGEDVGRSMKVDSIQTVSAKGEVMTPKQLQKWEEQQKSGGEEEEPENVSEAMPRFGSFVRDVLSEAEGEEDPGEAGIGLDPAEGAEEDEEAEAGIGLGQAEDGKENDQAENADEKDQAEDGDELVPPPATYMFWYNIVAEGQPEKDHTKEIEQLAKGGKLMLPGGSEWGIKFRAMGGSWDDGISFKKLKKELKGEIDGEKLQVEVNKIFSKNFPMIQKPDQGLRDARTILDGMSSMKFKEDFTEDIKKRIRDSAYSYYIQFKDNPAKPYMQKGDVVEMVNAALKQMGGRWLKFKSGISDKDVIELHATTGVGADTKAARDAVFRAVPSPVSIRNKTDGKKSSAWFDKGNFDPPKALDDLQKQFNALRKENSKFDDPSVKELLGIWYAFFKKYEPKPDILTVDDIKKFLEEYTKKYNELRIGDKLDESFESERGLMEDLFGGLYEEEAETEEGAGVGLDPAGGGEAGGDPAAVSYDWTIFVLPLPQLNKAFGDSSYY